MLRNFRSPTRKRDEGKKEGKMEKKRRKIVKEEVETYDDMMKDFFFFLGFLFLKTTGICFGLQKLEISIRKKHFTSGKKIRNQQQNKILIFLFTHTSFGNYQSCWQENSCITPAKRDTILCNWQSCLVNNFADFVDVCGEKLHFCPLLVTFHYKNISYLHLPTDVFFL